MSDWKIIIPESTRNMVLNPSAEIAGNYTAEAGTTVTRSTTYSHYGLYSYRVETNADNEGIELTLFALANNPHYVTMRVRGALPAWDWSLDDATFNAPTLIESIDGNWNLYGFVFPTAQATGSTKLSIHQNGAGSGDFYIDGIQVEEKSYWWTTYCDGTQPGCEWNGSEHASTSSRSAVSRAGGRVRDLQDDYYFNIGGMIGTGAAPQTVNIREYATLPGGEKTSVKTSQRVFTLTGVIYGTSWTDVHSKKQALIEELSGDTYPGDQPVTLRYTGATVQKQIQVDYETGLEGSYDAEDPCYWERVAVRFLAADPMWYEVGESAQLLDTGDSAIFNSIAGRLRSTGQWDNLNVGTAPATSNFIDVIVEGPDKKIYIGGYFTNWNGVVGRDYIAAYDPVTDSWETVGALTDFNNNVYNLAFGPDGTLYAVGDFTNVAGSGADYIAQWDGASWTAVGDPDVGTAVINFVTAIAIDTDGIIYVGGDFTDFANVGDADYIAQWDGASWTAVGSGGTSWIRNIAIDSSNNIYIAGSFTNWAGIGEADYVAVWDGTSWAALNNWSYGAGVALDDILVTEDDIVYIGGQLHDMGGITGADHVVGYNGTSFFALGDSVSADVYTMDYYNGSLYVAGSFGSLPGPWPIALPARIAKWNGASWSFLDGAFPLTANSYQALAVVNPDPVIQQNVDIYVGIRDPGVSYYAGITTVNNPGTARISPAIKFTRSGGTYARIFTVRNETTGKELLMYYALQDGETLTIDLSPTSKSIISSFYGSRLETILANSDFGAWSLGPNDNDITSFVNIGPDEQNDNNNQLSQWIGITGISENNTDNGRLYVSIVFDGGGFYHVNLYNDTARGAGDLVGHTASYNATGLQAIIEDNSSGLGGYIDIDAVVGADVDIYVDYALITAWLLWKDTYSSFD